MRRATILLGSLASLFMLGGALCAETNPCDDYVQYMCDCHGNDEGFSCDELRTTYENADPAQQDQCSIDLDDQQQQDEQDGITCDGSSSDTP